MNRAVPSDNRRRLSAQLVALALLVFTGFSVAPAPAAQAQTSSCTPVQGTFTNVFLTGPQSCPTSPVGLCTQGQLSGDLTGSYAFTFLTNDPVGDGGAAVTAFTGMSHVSTEAGTFTGQDFGLLRTTAFPLADFTTHLDIQSGTGAYEGARGQLTIQGTASFATGQGSGTYKGVVCVAR